MERRGGAVAKTANGAKGKSPIVINNECCIRARLSKGPQGRSTELNETSAAARCWHRGGIKEAINTNPTSMSGRCQINAKLLAADPRDVLEPRLAAGRPGVFSFPSWVFYLK